MNTTEIINMDLHVKRLRTLSKEPRTCLVTTQPARWICLNPNETPQFLFSEPSTQNAAVSFVVPTKVSKKYEATGKALQSYSMTQCIALHQP